MPEWQNQNIPKWRQEGRTGPGASAPQYSKASDRKKVLRGQPVGKSAPKKKKGCPLTLLLLMITILSPVAGAAYLVTEGLKRIF